MRVDLGKDRWAEVVDPDDMTHGTRMRVQALLPEFGEEGAHSFLVSLRMHSKLIAEVTTSWSLDLPLPAGDPDKLAELPGSAFDALKEATQPHMDRLDFIQAASTSSESKTPSADTTTSQDKGRRPKR